MSLQNRFAPRLQGPSDNFGGHFFCVEDEMLPFCSLLTLPWNVMELCLRPDDTLLSLPELFRHCQSWKRTSVITVQQTLSHEPADA